MNRSAILVSWYAQNEDTDEFGCLLQHSDAIEPERRTLAEMGAPDTEFLRFRDIVPEDRDSALCTAEATPAFHQWLLDNDMVP